MKKASLISFAVFFIVAGQAIGDSGWCDVEIVPQYPTSCDVVVITLSGEWPNSCIPMASAISVIDSNIYFDVIWDYPPDIICAMVVTPWERTRSVGPLSPGTYTVYARVFGYPYTPPTYTPMTEFTVTDESCVPTVYYVNEVDGNDLNDGLTPETAFATIQKGIDTAKSGDTVIVAPGVYIGKGNYEIDFYCKSITVCSVDPTDPDIVANTVIDCRSIPGRRAIHFHSNEGPNSILTGFTITNGDVGICCSDYSCPTISHCTIKNNCADIFSVGISCENSSPTITDCTISDNTASYGHGICAYYHSNVTIMNCTITNNLSEHGGGIYCCSESNLKIINCTITNNSARFYGGGIYAGKSNTIITNCTIAANTAGWQGGGVCNCYGPITNSIICNNVAPSYSQLSSCTNVTYSDIQGGWPGEGNIDIDPCFADADNSDYHLKSQAGRWEPSSQSWVQDEVTSPCIDAGNPSSPVGFEPFPNGGIINMGAYGGTAEASKSYFGEPVCEAIVAGDINGDCKVNFKDFALMALHWLEDNNL